MSGLVEQVGSPALPITGEARAKRVETTGVSTCYDKSQQFVLGYLNFIFLFSQSGVGPCDPAYLKYNTCQNCYDILRQVTCAL